MLPSPRRGEAEIARQFLAIRTILEKRLYNLSGCKIFGVDNCLALTRSAILHAVKGARNQLRADPTLSEFAMHSILELPCSLVFSQANCKSDNASPDFSDVEEVICGLVNRPENKSIYRVGYDFRTGRGIQIIEKAGRSEDVDNTGSV